MDEKQKATINSINKNDNKCFEYVITIALNHEEIKKDQIISKYQRISKTEVFVIKDN